MNENDLAELLKKSLKVQCDIVEESDEGRCAHVSILFKDEIISSDYFLLSTDGRL